MYNMYNNRDSYYFVSSNGKVSMTFIFALQNIIYNTLCEGLHDLQLWQDLKDQSTFFSLTQFSIYGFASA